MSNFLLNFDIRKKTGKKDNLILRKNLKIPSIIYCKKESIPVFFEKKDLISLSKIIAQGIKIIKSKIEEKEHIVLIKSFQKHPFKNEVLHFDFQKVEENEIITTYINLKFSDEKLCPGIKQGGFLIKHVSEIQIKSKVSKIPNYIEIDLSKLNVNENIFMSDLKLDNEITIPMLNKKKNLNFLIASIVGSRTDASKETQNK